MSLIDDALKRAQEEAARQEEAHRLAQRPWIAPPPPKRRRRAGAVAALSAGAAAALATLLLLRRSPSVSPVGEGRAASARPAPAARPPAPRLDTVEVPPPVLPSPEKGNRAAAPGPDAAPPLPKPNPEPPPAPAARSRPSPSLPDGKTFVRTAILPGGETIELDGIVLSDANPVAVIGGRVLAPGATVGDFEIVKIEENRVTLRGRGVTIFLTLS